MIGEAAVAVMLLVLPDTATITQPEFLGSLGETDGLIFLEIEGIGAWEDGRMVVADRLAGTVTLLDGSGTILAERVTGEPTAGISGGPAVLDCCGHVVAVADFASLRIRIFSRELIPMKTFEAEGAVIDLKFAPDTTLWICAQTRRGKELLHYDSDGVLLDRRLPAHLTGEAFSDICLCAVDRRGRVALVYCVRNIVELYDLPATFRTLSVPALPEEPPTRTVRRGLFSRSLHLPEGPLLRSVTRDEDDLLILGGDYGAHPGRDIYRLRPDGSCTTLVLARRASRISLTPGGLLLAVDDSKSRIDLYRLRDRREAP